VEVLIAEVPEHFCPSSFASVAGLAFPDYPKSAFVGGRASNGNLHFAASNQSG
jgi:hypothetical protein